MPDTVIQPARFSKIRPDGPLLSGLASSVGTWWRRYRTRRELMSLDDRSLKDIGIARCEIDGLSTALWRCRR